MAHQQVVSPISGFLRLPHVLQLIPISKSTLWAKVRAGSFPSPIKLGPRVTVWRAEDIRAYIENVATNGK